MVDAEGASPGHLMTSRLTPVMKDLTQKGHGMPLTPVTDTPPRAADGAGGGSITVTPACPSGCMHGSRRRPSGAPAW